MQRTDRVKNDAFVLFAVRLIGQAAGQYVK